MAIVKMKKMKIVGLSEEKEMVMDTLNHLRCVEIKSTKEIENTHTRLNVKRLAKTDSKLTKIANAITFLEEQHKERLILAKKEIVDYNPPKQPMFSARKEVDFNTFITSARHEYEEFAAIDILNNIGAEMGELRSERIKIQNKILSLGSFVDVDIPLDNIVNSKNTMMSLGTLPETSRNIITELNLIDLAEVYEIHSNGSILEIFVVCHNEVMEEVMEKLADAGFVKINLECDKVPYEEIEESKARIEKIDKRLLALNGKTINIYDELPKLKLLYDYYSFKKDKIMLQGDFRRTEAELVVAFESWIPENKVEFVQNKLNERTDYLYYEVTDPEKEEMPPTLTKNGKITSAYESVTNMYDVPSYYEQDPNFSVMIFFFIFFGFMVSDAGYGLLLAFAGFFLLKKFNLEEGQKSLALIIALGGISTIIWGILYGGIFSISIKGTIFEKLCWFTPLENPLGVLGISLALGVVQILYGMAMKAIQLVKRGKWFDAIADIGSWYVLFVGLGLLALGNFVPGFKNFANSGKIVSIVGVAMLVLTQGRDKKGIIGKLFGGIGSLYGIVNYLSDILSYSRLFGLGLATGVIGMVFNQIAVVFIGLVPIAGYLIGLIFILVGHVMNIGLAVLGAYVHNCRLQYIEFFSKFYEGGGHIFMPLGEKTKYVRVKTLK